MAGTGQAFAAAYDVHDAGLAVGPDAVQPVLEYPQPPRLRMPLPLGPITPRRALGSLLSDRQGQPALDGADTGFQVLDVRELAAAGQCPLVV